MANALCKVCGNTPEESKWWETTSTGHARQASISCSCGVHVTVDAANLVLIGESSREAGKRSWYAAMKDARGVWSYLNPADSANKKES